MGQTLTHGVYLPDEGERNCYNGLAANWQLLDGAVGTVADHTAQIAGKAPVAHTHTKSDVTDLLNSNFIPSANNSYDLGSSSYQWNNLYAKNYYYNGVAWGLDKSNVWTGNNEFNTNFVTVKGYRLRVKDYGMVLGTVPSSNQWTGFQFVDKNDTAISEIVQSFQSNGNELYQINVFPNEANSVKRSVITYTYNSANNANAVAFTSNVFPASTNAYDLGDSIHKWKTLNGVNPGALSLPDMGNVANTNYFDFSGSITHLDGTDNFYTPTVDGWMTVVIAGTLLSLFVDASSAQAKNQGTGISAAPVNGYCLATIPVRKNYRVKIQATGTSIYMAFVRPNLGNV